MKKNRLLTPGPTQIPGEVSSIFAQPIIHHRTPLFESIFSEVRKGLKYLYQTQQEVLLLTATGTGAMDAAVSNIFKQNDSVIVINGGKFGERWLKIAKSYALSPIEIRLSPGDAIEIPQLAQIVADNPHSKAILFQASETSTGVSMPSREICKLAQDSGMLSICDGITACGITPLPMDEWGIDVLITGSQKALMIPPGLSMIALSEKAWSYSECCNIPHFYFDLKKEKKFQLKNQTSWTPAISLIQGLNQSLKLIEEEGLPQLYKRHERLAKATRAAIEALGLEILAKKSPSTSVTAVRVPSAIEDGKQIPKIMRDRYGVTIVGGQDELEGKIIRLSHFGYCDDFDIITGISALELTLNDLGYTVEFGKGVGAALNIISGR